MVLREAFAFGTPAAVSGIGPLPSIVQAAVAWCSRQPIPNPGSAKCAARETPGLLERLGRALRARSRALWPCPAVLALPGWLASASAPKKLLQHAGFPYISLHAHRDQNPTFQKQAGKIRSEEECMAFITWIAEHPTAGDVIPGTDGARKVRWSVAGKGKSGGIRVMYFNLTEQGTVVLITLYQKAEQAHIQPSDIKKAL